MELRVLGTLEVADGNGVRAPAGAKERAVLARLLLEPGQQVAIDALVDAVWPDQDPRSAVRSLQVRIAHLRTLLEPGRPAGAPSLLLPREGDGYRLAIEPARVDAIRFAELAGRARALEPAAALAACDEALALWRGAPLADVAYADFAQAEIRRLEELRTAVELTRADALVALGRHGEAVPHLTRLAAARPLHEEIVRSLALALYRDQRQVEALGALRALGRALAELGLQPAAATRELEQRMLTHDPGLSAPAPTPNAAPAALPRRRSRFFGRRAQLERGAALVEQAPLVTIVGPAGVGKTRLALELAERLGSRMPGGVRLCELAPVDEPADVGSVVAHTLGVGGLDGDPGGEDRPATLLVLDNAEHVVTAVATAAEAVLDRHPGVRILATSRLPLGVEGERVLRVPGLELPAGADDPAAADSPAVALFVDRAGAAGAELSDDDLPAIAELCRRLDGLPLAIELAAIRTRSMAPAEIVARLDRRLALLAAPGRRAAARHATLRAAIDWSYELLDEPQRLLLERLSVFATGAALADAESACSDGDVPPGTVAGLLDELVAHSLVTPTTAGPATRYALLETVRAYAAERLAGRGETERWRDRHADRYVERAIEVRAAGWRSERLPFADDHDDLRAALRWCIARDATPVRAVVLVEGLWWHVHAHRADEIARLAEEALDRWPDGDHPRARMLGVASVARIVLGDVATAMAHAREAMALEQPGDEPALLARRTLAQVAFFAGDPEQALGRWIELAQLGRAAGFEAVAVEAGGFAVQLLHQLGDTAGALELAAQVRADADDLGSPIMTSWSRYVTGIALLDDDPPAATEWLEQALAIARRIAHHHLVRFSLRALGLAAAFAGDDDAASQRLAEALTHDLRASDAASQWTTLLSVAVVLAGRERDEPAALLLGAATAWPAAPLLRRLAEQTERRLDERLGGEALAAARERGRTLELPAARALALDELRAPRDAATAPPAPS